MQDPFPIIPSCFFPSDGGHDHNNRHHFADDVDPAAIATAAKPGRSVVASVYRTKIGGRCRPITITWCRDFLGHGFSVAVGAPDSAAAAAAAADAANSAPIDCKVELRPWQFWRRHGSKRFLAGGTAVEVFWDLRSAKFCGEPEPKSSYYVAVAADGDLALLLGDLRKEAYRKSGRQPAPIEAALVSRKEHIFGRKTFSTRSKFHEKGRSHEITIECKSGGSSFDSEMAISIDGEETITVKHLQWKFRGNQSITVSKAKVEVYWDVHNWLFSPGLRHALFIFKPTPMMACSSTSSSSSATLSSLLSSSPSPTEKKKSSSISSSAAAAAAAAGVEGCSGYCLFLYAWKLD
ncbi:hypothetical protein ACMD2_09548 [Ananas comosus]|uniref:DUF868 domain-containing protein n=1 Tax=Ananas comosus TaxID=4615 RepID=A0A199VCY2_ANACO|nr:hypothetical protein ACMD2_09548 [Ananas comosus]